jgi:peroxiredoxin
MLSTELQAYAASMRSTLSPEAMVKLEAMIARLQAIRAGADAPKVGDAAPPVQFMRMDGGTVSLSQALATGPVILIFYRGRWCPFCDLQLRAFDRSLGDITAAGAHLIAVSPQNSEELAKQTGEYKMSVELFSDPHNAAARAFNLVWASTPEEQELSKGWDVDLAQINSDDLWELPATAVFVIDRSGLVRWRQIDIDFTKRAEPEDVLAALRALPPS